MKSRPAQGINDFKVSIPGNFSIQPTKREFYGVLLTLSDSLLVLHFKYEILMSSKESLSTGLWTHRVTFPSLAAKYSTKTFTRSLPEP